MHLAGIDQEGSRFILSNKEKTYTIISLSDPTPPNERVNIFIWKKKRKLEHQQKNTLSSLSHLGKKQRDTKVHC